MPGRPRSTSARSGLEATISETPLRPSAAVETAWPIILSTAATESRLSPLSSTSTRRSAARPGGAPRPSRAAAPPPPGSDRAALEPDHPPHHREAQAEPALRAIERARALRKDVEHVR